MRIAMIGAGYVGLVSGACFSDFGHHVTCVDTGSGKIDALNNGEIPIHEPGLDALVASNAKQGRLKFVTDVTSAVGAAEVVFIAVGTPSRRGDGHADLSYVYAAAREIAKAIKKFTVVVNKSTVPVGSGDEDRAHHSRGEPGRRIRRGLESGIPARRRGYQRLQTSRPYRHRFQRSARQGCHGGSLPAAAPQLVADHVYGSPHGRTDQIRRQFVPGDQVAFINEIADLAEKVGANVQEVARGIGLDNRIGLKFLHAGPGYGGSCFPKDTLALIKTGQDYEAPLRIVETVVAVNDQRKRAMARKVAHAFGGNLRGKSIAILGVTFKPNTDDMRDAPSIPLITALQDMGAEVRVYDPVGMEQAKKVFENVTFCEGPMNAPAGVTPWSSSPNGSSSARSI